MSEPIRPGPDDELNSVILNEVQLLLSEKRTGLSTLRTGIAIFAFPLSVLSLLIATSSLYNFLEVIPLIVPLLLINLGLTVLAIYLIVHGIRRVRHYDNMINEFKRQHSRLTRLID